MTEASDWLIDRFAALDAYTVSDAVVAVGTGGVLKGVRPITSTTSLAGRARTVRVDYDPASSVPLNKYGADKFVDGLRAGDVAVIDGSGVQLSVFGDLATSSAQGRGATGLVVNAFVRDAEEMEKLDFPVFALGVGLASVAGHAYLTGVDEPVEIDGVEIRSGDMLLGSRGGVVVVPSDQAEAVLTEAERRTRVDEQMRAGMQQGTSFTSLWENEHGR